MMHAGFSAGALPFHTPFFALHMLGMSVVSIGVILLLIWAFKHLSEHKLWKWGWTLTIAGALLCFLTGMAMFGENGYSPRGGNRFYKTMPMMQQQGYEEDEEAQAREEAEGKALFDKLEARQMTCADLSDDDFELVGEYVMGIRAGDVHEQMNAMMKQMMGEKGEEQMHIVLGRSATGCDTAQGQPTGMMRGAMMQRASSSAR